MYFSYQCSFVYTKSLCTFMSFLYFSCRVRVLGTRIHFVLCLYLGLKYTTQKVHDTKRFARSNLYADVIRVVGRSWTCHVITIFVYLMQPLFLIL